MYIKILKFSLLYQNCNFSSFYFTLLDIFREHHKCQVAIGQTNRVVLKESSYFVILTSSHYGPQRPHTPNTKIPMNLNNPTTTTTDKTFEWHLIDRGTSVSLRSVVQSVTVRSGDEFFILRSKVNIISGFTSVYRILRDTLETCVGSRKTGRLE